MKHLKSIMLALLILAWPMSGVSAHELMTNVTIDDQVMEQLQANDSVELATYPVTMDSAREKLEAAIQAHYKIVNKEEHQIANGESGVAYSTQDKHQITVGFDPFLQSTSIIYSKLPISNLSNIATGALEYQSQHPDKNFSLSLTDEEVMDRIKQFIASYNLDIELENVQIHRLTKRSFQEHIAEYNQAEENKEDPVKLPDGYEFQDLYYVTATRAIKGTHFLSNDEIIGNPDAGNYVLGESYRFIFNQEEMLDSYILSHYQLQDSEGSLTFKPAKIIDLIKDKFADLIVTNPVHIDKISLGYAPIVTEAEPHSRKMRIEPVWIVHMRVTESEQNDTELFDMNLYFSPQTEKELLR